MERMTPVCVCYFTFLRNLSLEEPILSILDAKSKKPLKTYDLNTVWDTLFAFLLSFLV
jgi:hypothetical protein